MKESTNVALKESTGVTLEGSIAVANTGTVVQWCKASAVTLVLTATVSMSAISALILK